MHIILNLFNLCHYKQSLKQKPEVKENQQERPRKGIKVFRDLNCFARSDQGSS